MRRAAEVPGLRIRPSYEAVSAGKEIKLWAFYLSEDSGAIVTQAITWSKSGDEHLKVDWSPQEDGSLNITADWVDVPPSTAFVPLTVIASYTLPNESTVVTEKTQLYVLAAHTDPDKVLYIYDENKETHVINMNVTPWTMGKLPVRPQVTDVFIMNGVVAVDIKQEYVLTTNPRAYSLMTCFLLNLDSLNKI